ncbi:MAG TPA: hypothetical protein PLX83_21575, partial [bacterium]|nr:hypothetical protein [bacterium]
KGQMKPERRRFSASFKARIVRAAEAARRKSKTIQFFGLIDSLCSTTPVRRTAKKFFERQHGKEIKNFRTIGSLI